MIFSSRGRQRLQHLRGLLAQIQIDHRFGRRDAALIHDEIAQMRFFFLADRRFQRNRLLRDAHHFAHFRDRQPISASSSLVGSRPSSCTSWREVRTSLLMVSIMCTGMRMVRA